MTADNNVSRDMLREMAQHRGLRLKASRRRKPGGDFGLFGLEEAGGKPVLGIGEAGLEATAEEVETYLRSSMRSTWESSAQGLPKVVRSPEPAPETKAKPEPRAKSKPPARPKPAPKPKPEPPPPPPPPPPPRFEPEVANLFADVPMAKSAEAVTDLLDRAGVRIERIVSRGRATPPDDPIVRRHDVWIVLLQGAAGLRIDDSAEVRLKPGDHVAVAAGQRCWLVTVAASATVWLVVHLDRGG